MLKLKDIKKDYYAGGTTVNALKGINLSFRQNEFVSILGPSGCGKTTMLNIIGGLDHYTSGDLIIDNVSTKSYSDRDWDTYRNHRVGFVFQSYNLIPHQTILENVALALNISGVDKKQRTIKAKQALDKVGLKNQYNKKPNQLSGGQCQRVAIARALVNDPEILLADEPTGALDSETSVQIMNLIQEVAKECLVIMVTHNPELAKQYSTRIINLLDGNVVSDSNPYDESSEILTENAEKNTPKKSKPNKKSKLSFWSAFKLSAKNLWSKFKRTFMVCLAGSIGIIGVATVLAVSSGVQGYISSMQNDMLSGNPISISEETINLNALVGSSSTIMKTEAVKNSTEDGYIYVDSVVDYLVSRSGDVSNLKVSNNITQNYVDFVYQMPEEYYNAIVSYYGIDIANNIYTDFNFVGQTNNNLSLTAGTQIYTALLNSTDYGSFSQYISSLSDCFMQAPNNEEFILSQYDIISNPETSHIAKDSNEIMLVVSDESTLSDLLLAQLGYFSQEEFLNLVYKSTNDSHYDPEFDIDKFSYDTLLNKKFYYYPNDTVFNKTPEDSPLYSSNPFTYNAYKDSSWENGKELKLTAILRPKKDVSYGCLESGVYYTKALAEEIIQTNTNSEIVQYLLEKEDDERSFTSAQVNGFNTGITYSYSYKFNSDEALSTDVGFVGSVSQTSALIGSMTGQNLPEYHILTLRDLGGVSLPNKIEIYPTDFNFKDDVTAYLKTWNEDVDITINGIVLSSSDREEITYTDNLSIVISLVNNLVNIVTTALVAFTALSLVVSTVMVAIITYVSVMERVKEIGVIRSMGGRKKDVSNLFIAETFIIGSVSGIIGILITYLLSGIINLIVGNLVGIYTLANLSPITALIMILISIVLTLISGLIPASMAAKKDPVVALRSE